MGMPELLRTCLIVCPLVFLAGFVDSVAGGGGIISIPAYLLAGVPTRLALGTNKLVNCFGTGLSVGKYLKNGKVRLRVAVISALGSILGSFVGTRLALLVREQTLRVAVLVALPCVALFLCFNRGFGSEGRERDLSPAASAAVSLAIGLVIGCYDGLIGPGTGTFLILAFTAFLGLDLLTASGCAKVSNLASNITSAIVYIASGNVRYLLALPAVVFCMAGNYLGARYAIRGGSRNVRRVMFLVLGLLFVKVIVDFIRA